MAKWLKIYDDDTGEVVEEIKFTGGYNIQWTHHDDPGRIHHVTNLLNAKWGEKHWIKNYSYSEISKRLIARFEELNGINPNEILFLEDTEWEPGGAKYNWKAQTKKANKQLTELTGFKWIIETRQYYTNQMSREQLILLLYHELRHIDPSDDGLKKHDVEEWNNIVATFGRGWDTTKSSIQDILDNEFEDWDILIKTERQLTLFDNGAHLKAVK